MTVYQNDHYKEDNPQNTVARIKGILANLGIKLHEEWVKTDTINTFSLRVTIENTSIGSNGKGVTKEYAMASAYSEFMERYQNLWLARWNNLWKDGNKFRYYVDEIYLTAEEIVRSNSAFMKMYFKKRDMSDSGFLEKVKAFKKVQKMDFNFTEKDNEYLCVPFFNLQQNKVEYIPYYAYTSYYLSNGMCAGNTPEEALVQGLSEIMERVVQKRIALEKPSLPDIPEEYLKRFPYVYELFQQLKETPGYTVMLKDCSFGGEYPVAGLVIIEKNTGNYGFKLGCHPDYGVAIERTLTEAAQGSDILLYSKRSKLDFTNSRVSDGSNILNGFKSGIAQYPYEILLETEEPFIPVEDVSNYNNKQILNKLVEKLSSAGYEILTRDVSYLGHPAYQIIIPGLSEVFDMTDYWYNAINTKFHVLKLLNFPSRINKDNVKYIIGIMDCYANSQLENSMRSYYGVLSNISCPAEEYGLGWLYYTAMGFALIEDYKKASERMFIIVSQAENKNPFYYAVYQYFCGMIYENNHKKVISYLRSFFEQSICDKINIIFQDPGKILEEQYPEHNFLDHEECEQQRCCDYYAYKSIVTKYKEVQKLHPIIQEDILESFSGEREENKVLA
ncbi:MAG: YcaO-like family protein [Mobilitalea sp.]